LRLEKFG